MRKFVQKRVFDFLSTSWGVGIFLVTLVTCSIIFAQVLLVLSGKSHVPPPVICPCRRDFTDNLAGTTFEDRLCLPEIDVVYTWVNGSDPRLQKQLREYTARPEFEENLARLNLTGNTTLITDEANDVSANNRYRDNHELRYSLRSLEKFAPWVRNVYIVTNGQVPHWLDLSSPRVQIITHEMLFPNTEHLPCFSSPAIESHLHRIPGLSDKFLYFNDDVFLGNTVWPDDFYTQANGQKVYLSWGVPHCNTGCPDSWVGDGFCDRACNTTECGFDAGDCANVTDSTAGWGWGGAGAQGGDSAAAGSQYCNTGCPDSWVGDKFCDRTCNNIECGFDAGDCGLDNFGAPLTGAAVSLALDELTLDHDLPATFLNLTAVYGGGRITKASHSNPDVVRTAVISQKHKLMTVVFFPAVANASVTIDIEGEDRDGEHVAYTVDLTIRGRPPSTGNGTSSVSGSDAPPQLQVDGDIVSNAAADYLPPDYSPDGVSAPPTLPPSPGADGGDGGDVASADAPSTSRSLSGLVSSPSTARTLSWFSGQDVMIETEEDVADAAFLHDMQLFSRGEGPLVRDEGGESGESKGTVDDELVPVRVSKRYGKRKNKNKSKSASKSTSSAAPQSTAVDAGSSRRLLDTFGDSLRHVHRLFNAEFGHSPRKVPAHMPHLIDRHIMGRLQERFAHEFEKTSANRFRSPDDMQYAFAYMYYMINEEQAANVRHQFDVADANNDGVLNTNELRTLAAVLREPHQYGSTFVTDLRRDILGDRPASTPITFELVSANEDVVKKLTDAVAATTKRHKYEVVGTEEVAFYMIRNNDTKALDALDGIRQRRQKFVCINDNMNSSQPIDGVVRVLHDFYESYFPLASQFELPDGQQNASLYYDELVSVERKRRAVVWPLYAAVFIVVGLLVFRFVRGQQLQHVEKKRFYAV